MFVVADGLCFDAVVLQQLVSVARIFTGNKVDIVENLDRSVGDIRQIADRSGNYIQGTVHRTILASRRGNWKTRHYKIILESFGRINIHQGKGLDPKNWAKAFESRLNSGLIQAGLPREWNSSPPIVVVPVGVTAAIVVIASTAIVATVVSEAICVAYDTELLLDLRPLRPEPTVEPSRTSNAINLLGFLQHASSFIRAPIHIPAVAKTRLQIADRITKLMYFLIDSIFTLGAIDAAAIQRSIHVALEIFCQTIQTMYGVAHVTLVVTSVTAIATIRVPIVGVASPLSGCHGRQAQRKNGSGQH
jgi:hypothetical protein